MDVTLNVDTPGVEELDSIMLGVINTTANELAAAHARYVKQMLDVFKNVNYDSLDRDTEILRELQNTLALSQGVVS